MTEIFKPSDYKEWKEKVGNYEVHIVSYRLGDIFCCVVDNVDPGAVIARTHGINRDEVEREAIDRARARLEK